MELYTGCSPEGHLMAAGAFGGGLSLKPFPGFSVAAGFEVMLEGSGQGGVGILAVEFEGLDRLCEVFRAVFPGGIDGFEIGGECLSDLIQFIHLNNVTGLGEVASWISGG